MNWERAAGGILSIFVQQERPGIFLDFDGTLSPIVNVPEEAQITMEARHQLKHLVERYPLVGIISGRAPADVAERVGVDGLVYAGNHGLEQLMDGQVVLHPEAAPYMERLQDAAAELVDWLLTGMSLEDKGVTISIHYRNADDPEAVVRDLGPRLKTYTEQHGLQLNHGRMVYELRPPVQVDKGSAFRQLIESHHLDAAIYVGDDTTDVDVFQIATRMRAEGQVFGAAVGVRSAETPQAIIDHADLLVDGVAAVEKLLSWLSSERKQFNSG